MILENAFQRNLVNKWSNLEAYAVLKIELLYGVQMGQECILEQKQC